jgi:hypothetical protein
MKNNKIEKGKITIYSFFGQVNDFKLTLFDIICLLGGVNFGIFFDFGMNLDSKRILRPIFMCSCSEMGFWHKKREKFTKSWPNNFFSSNISIWSSSNP